MRGHAVIATGDLADHQLDGFAVLGAEAAGGQHAVGGEHRLERLGAEGADGGEGVRHLAGGFPDLGVDLGAGAGGGFDRGSMDTGHGDAPVLMDGSDGAYCAV